MGHFGESHLVEGITTLSLIDAIPLKNWGLCEAGWVSDKEGNYWEVKELTQEQNWWKGEMEKEAGKNMINMILPRVRKAACIITSRSAALP